MERILFISNRYPSEETPTNHVFVQQLVWSMADLGVKCTVISPIPVNKNRKLLKVPLHKVEKTPKNNIVDVYFPRYISLGQKKILGINSAQITANTFTNAVIQQIEKLNEKPQAVYGHFLSPAGICASRVGRKYNIPAFAAFGESTPWSINNFGLEEIRSELKTLAGIVSVSSHNKRVLTELGVYRNADIEVFPNAVRSELYYPRNKEESRIRFGFPQNDFIVAFVGQFNNRKGVLRVSKALDGLNDISVAYAGKGKLKPNNSNTIYSDSVKPENMPYFLSAADVFVLPTLNEGCCNAIIEAMACGLPIISSNLPFNNDILDEKNSILINPNSVNEIKDAVLYLKERPEILERKKQGSLIKSSQLTLEKRASSILNWINKKTEEYYNFPGFKLSKY